MSTPHDKSSHNTPGAAPCEPNEKQGDASAQLAHELANLLDGSLRHLGIAISSLGEASLPTDDLEQRLQTANTSMQHMAQLIHRWMRQSQTPGGLFHQQRTLAESVDHAVRLFSAEAGLLQIDIQVDLDPQAAGRPAGPAYPIVANALRNSIEAIEQSGNVNGDEPAVIAISARVTDGDMELIITDNGPGLDPLLVDEHGQFQFGRTTKPGGHGLGLALCRDLARELGGSIELTGHEPHGTQLTVRYPVTNRAAQTRPT